MLVTEKDGLTPGCTMFDVEVRRVPIELVRMIWELRRTSEVISDMGDTVVLIVRKGCLVFALVVQQNHQGNPTQPLSPWEGLKSSYGGEVLAAHVLTLAIHTPFTGGVGGEAHPAHMLNSIALTPFTRWGEGGDQPTH